MQTNQTNQTTLPSETGHWLEEFRVLLNHNVPVAFHRDTFLPPKPVVVHQKKGINNLGDALTKLGL